MSEQVDPPAGRPERCEACRYWQPAVEPDGRAGHQTISADSGMKGECRRHAPRRLLADAPEALDAFCKVDGEYDDPETGGYSQLLRVFPLTRRFDWCGEYRPENSRPKKTTHTHTLADEVAGWSDERLRKEWRAHEAMGLETAAIWRRFLVTRGLLPKEAGR